MNKNKNSITAIIIALNEEKLLSTCLKSLDWADEIIVIDTGSTDKTDQIAKKHKARVVEYTSGKSFSDWRNKGLKEAKGDWVFYIDADETVSGALAKEIQRAINSSEYSWYAIPRSNIIFGREFRYGGWWPDYVKRLFSKNYISGWSGNLHEEPSTKGKMGYLTNHLLHNKHETISEMVEKTNSWSEIEGKLMFDANHPPMNVWRFSTAMFREFWYRMVVKLAFLDGREGIIMAIYQVYSRFCSYAKLWELQVNSKNKKL